MTKTWVAILYLAGAALVAVFLVSATGLADKYRLAHDGVCATGTVARLVCEEHLEFYYQFTLQEKSFSGRTSSGRCRGLRVGDGVEVHYLAGDPRINTAGDPQYEYHNDLTAIIFATLGMPAGLVIVLWERSRRRRWSGSR